MYSSSDGLAIFESYSFDLLEDVEFCSGYELSIFFDVLINQYLPDKDIKQPHIDTYYLYGVEINELLLKLSNNNFDDIRNPIDYNGSYENVKLENGESLIISKGYYGDDNYYPPILSGKVLIGNFVLHYIFASQSYIWSLLYNGKRFVITAKNRGNFKFPSEQIEGDGKCVLGSYKGLHLKETLLKELDNKIRSRKDSTDFLYPEGYDYRKELIYKYNIDPDLYDE